MTRRTAREMAEERWGIAQRKTEAARARLRRAEGEVKAAKAALDIAKTAEEYAAAHPLLAEPVLTEVVAE